MNFKKADWPLFQRLTEKAFKKSRLPKTSSSGVKTFNRIILDAAKESIPAGYRKEFTPGIPRAALDLFNARDEARNRDPTDPSVGLLHEEAATVIRNAHEEEWRAECESVNRDGNKLWGLLRKFEGRRRQPPANQPINFSGKVLTKHQSIAKYFCKQFTSQGTHRTSRRTRKIVRKFSKLPLNRSFAPFDDVKVTAVIRKAKASTAVGPDRLMMIHLKHLGPRGIRFLTSLCNHSVAKAEIPALWKTARIVPVPKPGKPPGDSLSSRPISLLCPPKKVLEALVLPFLDIFPKNPTQNGFKRRHSTITALLPICQQTIRGFNQPKPADRTTLLAIDLSKAFDMINHTILLEKIFATQLHNNIKRWLKSYLRGRQAYCCYQTAVSKLRICRSGVPQGSGLAADLFNLYLYDLPIPAPVSALEGYADDLSAAASSPNPASNDLALTSAAANIQDWVDTNLMRVAPAKSNTIMLSPWSAEARYDPAVSIGGVRVPAAEVPQGARSRQLEILGIKWDSSFTFGPHCTYQAQKADKRIDLMKAIAGHDWGCSQELLTLTYKANVESILTYGAAIIYPIASPTSIDLLARKQIKALKIATRNHTNASDAHVLNEAQVLPIATKLDLLSSQFLAGACRVDHPSRATAWMMPRARQDGTVMKETLASKCGRNVRIHLDDDGNILEPVYKQKISRIHTAITARHLRTQPPNRVLGHKPPKVKHDIEKKLPVVHRSTLS